MKSLKPRSIDEMFTSPFLSYLTLIYSFKVPTSWTQQSSSLSKLESNSKRPTVKKSYSRKNIRTSGWDRLNIFFRMKLDKIIFFRMSKMLVGGGQPHRSKSILSFFLGILRCKRTHFLRQVVDSGSGYKLWLWPEECRVSVADSWAS